MPAKPLCFKHPIFSPLWRLANGFGRGEAVVWEPRGSASQESEEGAAS